MTFHNVLLTLMFFNMFALYYANFHSKYFLYNLLGKNMLLLFLYLYPVSAKYLYDIYTTSAQRLRR